MLTPRTKYVIIWITSLVRGVFLRREKLWQRKMSLVHTSQLLAQNAKKEIIQQAKTKEIMQKESKFLNSAQDATNILHTKKQNKE